MALNLLCCWLDRHGRFWRDPHCWRAGGDGKGEIEIFPYPLYLLSRAAPHPTPPNFCPEDGGIISFRNSVNTTHIHPTKSCKSRLHINNESSWCWNFRSWFIAGKCSLHSVYVHTMLWDVTVLSSSSDGQLYQNIIAKSYFTSWCLRSTVGCQLNSLSPPLYFCLYAIKQREATLKFVQNIFRFDEN